MDRTAAQVKAHYVQQMGPELGLHFHSLWHRTAWVFSKWETYTDLFGHGPERVELLNRAAPAFFRTVQDSFIDDILMHIARLTDPPGSEHRANLTILNLPALVDSVRDDGRTRSACDKAAAAAENCRVLRNKRLAHDDLEHALGRATAALPGVSRKQIGDALDGIAESLNVVSNLYDCGTIAFEHVIQPLGGTASLVRILNLGVSADEEHRVRRGAHPVPPATD